MPVRLGSKTAKTDDRGLYRFVNPAAGDQLVAVDPTWLAGKRQKLSDGTLTGAFHADQSWWTSPPKASHRPRRRFS
ncbi:MAG: hypothetical protein U0231_04585 [Nitrospiraceae bacterium]